MTTPAIQIARCRRHGWIVAAIAAALLTGGFAVLPRVPLVLYNRTPSMATGVYVRVGGTPRRADVVAFVLPAAARGYARLRGERPDVLLLKHVLAIGGDRVSTLGGRLTINGVDVGPIAAIDAAGRPLPRWEANRVLTTGELLAGSTRPRSFDGRFFGPIHSADVLGVYRRIGFGGASAVSSPQRTADEPDAQEVAAMTPAARQMPRGSGGNVAGRAANRGP